MRRTWSLVLLAALGLAGWLAFGWTGGARKGPAYLTTPVDRGPIDATVAATGTVNPVTSVQVGTYVSGPIQSIYVDYNSPVHKGLLLAKIDPRPFQVKLDDATAALANTRARLEKDRADARLKAITLARSRQLDRNGILSTSDLDLAVSQNSQARAQITLDEADVQSAEAKVHEAEVNLAYTDITSPVDGVVVSRNVAVGQTVAATFQTPTLFVVAGDLTKMSVVASISESDIGTVAPGQEVAFTVDAYPSDSFHGRVGQVRNAPITVQNVVTYEVLIDVRNEDLRLKPGMTANVTITTATRADALRVSTAALRFRPPAVGDGNGTAVAADRLAPRGPRVWVIDDGGQPRPVTIVTGIADDRFTEVKSGLAAGDRVITGIQRDASASSAAGTPPSFAPARRAH